MKPFDYYKDVKVKYPTKEDFMTTYWYKAGAVIAMRKGRGEIRRVPDDGRAIDIKELDGLVTDSTLDVASYAAAKVAYEKEAGRLSTEFMEDCFEDLGIEDDSRRHVMYNEAYERGHSGGHYEVHSTLSSIVDFVDRLDHVVEAAK